jgi:hypothetical protein
MLKAARRVLTGIILIPLGGTLLLIAYLWSSGPPSDAALEQQFPSREPELQKLVVVAKQDQHLVTIDPTFTSLDTDASWPRPNSGLSTERWNRYRSLFDQAGLRKGITKDDGDVIYFTIYYYGFVAASVSKGYVYSEKQLSPTFASLDTMPSGIKPKFSGTYVIAYKPLKKNWYLFRDEN